MNIVRGYFFIIFAMLFYSTLAPMIQATSLSQRLIEAIGTLRVKPQEACSDSTECLEEQKCDDAKCQALCPGACGTDALCRGKNHKAVCSCARCYEGNPHEICTAYPGLRFLKCIIGK